VPLATGQRQVFVTANAANRPTDGCCYGIFRSKPEIDRGARTIRAMTGCLCISPEDHGRWRVGPPWTSGNVGTGVFPRRVLFRRADASAGDRFIPGTSASSVKLSQDVEDDSARRVDKTNPEQIGTPGESMEGHCATW